MLAGGPSTLPVSAPDPPPPVIIPVPTDIEAAESDPVAALEAAVEADKPK
jgi:hypothetical protein